jgi:hypothetical protein
MRRQRLQRFIRGTLSAPGMSWFRSSRSLIGLGRDLPGIYSDPVRLLGVLSAVVLNLVIWGFIAVLFTVGLAAADVSATTFYVVWAFFAAVMLGGTFLMLRWGQEGRRWLWRISISWSILFLVLVGTLLVALIPLGLLALIPRFRGWLSSWLVPPRPALEALPPGAADSE